MSVRLYESRPVARIFHGRDGGGGVHTPITGTKCLNDGPCKCRRHMTFRGLRSIVSRKNVEI